MDAWEFLLQRAGDQDWLPLEMPTGEILEGRYRVIARSHDPATPVIVHVSHQYEQNGLPKRRVQQRSQSINHQGVVDILPFTYLEPGLWQLTCQGVEQLEGDMPAGDEGEFIPGQWRQTVQLRVLAQDASDIADWEPLEPPVLSLEPQPVTPRALAQLPTFDWSTLDQVLDTQFQHLEPLELPTVATPVAAPGRVQTAVGQTAPAASTAQAQPRRRIVDLPVIPAEVKPLHLRISQGVSLPPQLFQTLPSVVGEPQLPVLPARHSGTSAMGTLIKQKLATPEETPAASAIDTAFEALNLQQRFWVNLNALAQPVDQCLQTELTAAPASSDPELLEPETATTSELQAADPLLSAVESLTGLSAFGAESAESMASAVNPLPVPELIVLQAELVPNQAVLVQVRLPQPCPLVGVKVWLQDSNTQEILEGPRWLVDFKHNWQLGMLEANTQIIVPEFHQRVTFTAIAVHWHTQQTSHEVTIERPVFLTRPYEPDVDQDVNHENLDL